ncbi:MAG: FIST C-terminal domain-containing protein [Kofleriaceae bacterium]|nr:FIST C-terminal domain-containing protein [Kofleriaceae bacterium]
MRVTPFHLDADPDTWAAAIDVAPATEAAFLVLPCPLSFPVEELLEFLDDRWPSAAKVGGLASGGMTASGPAGNTLFLGDQRLDGGAVGIALEGDVRVDTVVAQGCRPIGEPMIVTRAHGNVALALDGQPPVVALDRLCRTLPDDDRALCRHSLFLGLSLRRGVVGPDPPRQGDFLIRNLVGLDPDSGAMAVGAPLEVGQVVQFHLRDGGTSAADLAELLEGHDGAPPAGALLFSCVGRGRLMYGTANHDSRMFRRLIGDVPLGGFFCNGEIGPVHRRTYLHGYTSSFALFRKRSTDA